MNTEVNTAILEELHVPQIISILGPNLSLQLERNPNVPLTPEALHCLT